MKIRIYWHIQEDYQALRLLSFLVQYRNSHLLAA
jgi:hypothetical protein